MTKGFTMTNSDLKFVLDFFKVFVATCTFFLLFPMPRSKITCIPRNACVPSSEIFRKLEAKIWLVSWRFKTPFWTVFDWKRFEFSLFLTKEYRKWLPSSHCHFYGNAIEGPFSLHVDQYYFRGEGSPIVNLTANFMQPFSFKKLLTPFYCIVIKIFP